MPRAKEDVAAETVEAIKSGLGSKEFQDKPLVTKLALIMGMVGYIPKTGWNDFHKYKYVEEASLVSTIRPLLSHAGIIIIPDVIAEEWVPEAVAERSGKSSLCKVMVQYTITDGKDSFTMRVPGYGVDKSDKSVYKALTGSMKYALMKLFMVETGDDPERESAGSDGSDVVISHHDEQVGKGGHSEKATRYQLQRISATMRDKGLTRSDLLTAISLLFGVSLELPDDDAAASRVIAQYLADLDSADAGALLARLDGHEVAHA